MKKIIFITFLILLSCKSNKLKTTIPPNAIFIFFEEGDMSIKFKSNLNRDKLPEYNSIIYRFKLNEKDYIQFTHQKYLDFDAKENDVISKVLIKRKKFLKKNEIIGFNNFKKWGLYESTVKTMGLKKIFIIDKSEFKKNKIILRQVSAFSSYTFEE